MVDLTKQLRQAMKRSGLTRNQIALRSGVGYAVIHGFASGKQDVMMGTASKIADVLGLELRPKRRR